MEPEISSKEMDELFEVILKLKNVDECRKFFRDICTYSELKAISERLQVAKCVNEKISYRNISQKTGSSTATITRVAHWLHHGMGGYRLVLGRLNSH